MRVSVLGIGTMGRAVAIRLRQKGYHVTAWNRTTGKARELEEQGATVAETPGEAVAQADVVVTVLSNDDAVRTVCLGPQGVIGSLPNRAVLVDMSSVHPDTSRALASAAGGRFIDAPILGGPEALVSGMAKYLVAGPESLVRRLEPLWSDLGAAYFYTGENGTAAALKLLSNLILVGSTELLMEAVVTAQAHGIGNEVLREVFGGSPAVAPGVKARLDDVLGGDHEGWWTLELADKDMTLVLKLASAVQVELPLAAATEATISRAIAAGYGNKDLGALTEVLRAAERVQ